ncbi:hypothetical protein [Azoarcus taiwanensis]|uniref:Nucleotidyltransferase n=1 Tax=Azoarcus taiwanensis TaxID=666964 RepID=A0A972FE09_9RHOO|nr:hypothetical protein [Azoarcus taiwanensis]NMG03587.1 hypothetical protein [Azoarcus taiwanensis]
MTSDIDSRLSQLRARRKGEPSLVAFSEAAAASNRYFTADAAEVEDWEKRGTSSQRWTRYAIGGMQAVGKKYTEVSVQTGERVASQLRDRLAKAGIDAEFRLQGSVPLDVHIKRVSDVDVLAIRKDFYTYNNAGVQALRGGYRNPSRMTSSGVLSSLRQQVESDLVDAFPAAKVDKTGAKAVRVSGGSLQRSVDVVPAHWYDTKEYQASGRQADRAVTIYNKNTGETIDNLPFLHIERVACRCDSINGGLRKAIRLCKNVKADSDRDIQLSSYDIAAIMYHADMSALRLGQYSDLAVLTETQRHLDALYQDPSAASKLWVPDGSRVIFDTSEKRDWLLQLSVEMDELLQNVYQENFPGQISSSSSRGVQRELIKALKV